MIEEGGAVEELWLEASDVDGVGVFETKEGVLNLLDLGGEGAMGQDEVDAIVEGSGVWVGFGRMSICTGGSSRENAALCDVLIGC